MPLHTGLYEQPISVALAEDLTHIGRELVRIRDLDPDEAPHLLGRTLYERILHALASYKGKPEERRTQQLHLANRIIELLIAESPKSGADTKDKLVDAAQKLLAVLEPAEGLGQVREPPRPGIGLTASELLVNGPRDLRIGRELELELASANRVDLLCSFLKNSGLRIIKSALGDFLERHPGGLRVITTTYMGATEQKALDLLLDMGAQLKVSYDSKRTRLHAKAWLIHRDSGFSTAFIGSSNLSHKAMVDGVEWNVRVSKSDNAGILQKFETVFDQYWNDPSFEPYQTTEDRERFEIALRQETAPLADLRFSIDLHPRPHQERILESLASERELGHHRNLVVAATGTGKTIVAAIDYARLSKRNKGLSLLFVAHRKEILEQSLMTFRVATRDGSFGELLVAGDRPKAGRHVFASVQSLHADRLAELDPEAFDVVVVDEFHHAAAPTYDRLLDHLKPKYLLGLTATPERTDGKSILGWFDGRIAAELRLWEALDQSLLSPFQYFGISDGTDLSHVRWTSTGYDATELGNVYTGNHIWAKRVLQEVHDKISHVSSMCALGFCVSIDHAEFMAQQFSQAGLPARAVSSRTPHDERGTALAALRDGHLRALFTVDLFNEGVDLPDVDTVLFLRPTESATVFLQQLGRGLRLSDDKECLTVLDFIGQAHRKFRFDARFRAIVGGTRRQVQQAVEQDFPHLPSGCSIQLERHAKELVLENIRNALGLGQRGLIEDLRALGRDVSLAEFMREADLDLEDIYPKPGASWTAVRRKAGLVSHAESEDEKKLLRSIGRLTYINDIPRIRAWRALLNGPRPPVADDQDPWQRLLYVSLGHFNRPYVEMGAAFQELWAQSTVRTELLEVLDLLEDRIRRRTIEVPGLVLRAHADYSLDEIAAAFDKRTAKGALRRPQGMGVMYEESVNTDMFFVTLEKLESEYTPSTLYNDYPISERLFHWESQSTTHGDTPTGQRYIHHDESGGRILLFVRRQKRDPRGFTSAYTFLGPAHYVSHKGSRPMQIIWELEHPMPADMYEQVKVAAG